jgi:hypothetical protein
VTGPLTAELIANIDSLTHVISGRYVVALSSVREFLVGLASWADTLLNEVDESDQNDLQHDIAFVYVTACDRIHEISAYRDRNNNAMANPGSIPLVLPHELIKLSAANFIRKIRQHAFRLDHCYSSTQIELIVDEHKALIHAHRCEPVLKDNIDSLSNSSSFKDGWSLLGARFPNDGILWCHCNAFSWNQYCRVRFFNPTLGEGFVPQAFIELWIRTSHACKTVLVHRAVPALINAN